MAPQIKRPPAFPLIIILALAGCSGGPAAVETAPSTTAPSSSATGSEGSTPSTTSSPSTETTGITEEAWSESDAERHAINYLAALAAGAFEQAAWPIENNGGVIDGQARDERAGEALERLCASGACRGPYIVEADGPGLIDPGTRQASSTVTVTHSDSGQQATLTLGTFEGQLMVTGLPPLVPSPGAPSLIESLFAEGVPERVVVARFDAFEIWDNGQPEWVTNWWADDAVQVEGDVLVGHGVLANVHDPQVTYDGECVRLMSRDGEVLALEQCDTASWRLFNVVSGEARVPPVAFETRGDGEYVWFVERGGTVIDGLGDAEGNLTGLSNQDGLDLLGGGYAGYVALSTDGASVAYVDHAEPSAYSHFWSPVVVVKDTSTGEELGRWILDNPILSLELARPWLVVAEADPAVLAGGDAEQIALTAINVDTGATTRVETPSRVFLPSQLRSTQGT